MPCGGDQHLLSGFPGPSLVSFSLTILYFLVLRSSSFTLLWSSIPGWSSSIVVVTSLAGCEIGGCGDGMGVFTGWLGAGALFASWLVGLGVVVVVWVWWFLTGLPPCRMVEVGWVTSVIPLPFLTYRTSFKIYSGKTRPDRHSDNKTTSVHLDWD